jgi:hypothetical protein
MGRWNDGCDFFFFFFFFIVWRCHGGKLTEYVFMLFSSGHLVKHPGVQSCALEGPQELFNLPCNLSENKTGLLRQANAPCNKWPRP